MDLDGYHKILRALEKKGIDESTKEAASLLC